MTILIKGMEMPKEGKRALWLVIHADGTVEYDTGDYGWQTTSSNKAVSVPPHGRLIDADDIENITVIMNENGTGFNRIVAPTIIDAEVDDDTEISKK